MVAVFDSEREQISIVHLRSTKSEVVSISHLCVLRKDSRAMYGKEEPFHRLLARIHMFFHRFPFFFSLSLYSAQPSKHTPHACFNFSLFSRFEAGLSMHGLTAASVNQGRKKPIELRRGSFDFGILEKKKKRDLWRNMETFKKKENTSIRSCLSHYYRWATS